MCCRLTSSASGVLTKLELSVAGFLFCSVSNSDMLRGVSRGPSHGLVRVGLSARLTRTMSVNKGHFKHCQARLCKST
jgi:hypothetical protein